MNTSRRSKYLTISATALLGLVGSAALVWAGPITGGSGNPPYTKLGVYQGVIAVIPGGCPMMFCPPVDFGHQCMRGLLRATGSLRIEEAIGRA